MAATGVATVAALEVIGGGEDQIGAFIVKVFRGKFAERGGRDALDEARWRSAGWFGFVCHYWNNLSSFCGA